jgi:hypothetical protein
MSNKSKRSIPPPKSQKSLRPRWLWPAVIGGVAVVVIAGVIWLVQAQQKPTVTTTPVVTGQTPAVTGQPSASIDKTNFDYGDVRLGNTIQTVFNVKNVGDKDLVFQREPRVEVLAGC